jgi:hypothetical protein
MGLVEADATQAVQSLGVLVRGADNITEDALRKALAVRKPDWPQESAS